MCFFQHNFFQFYIFIACVHLFKFRLCMYIQCKYNYIFDQIRTELVLFGIFVIGDLPQLYA